MIRRERRESYFGVNIAQIFISQLRGYFGVTPRKRILRVKVSAHDQYLVRSLYFTTSRFNLSTHPLCLFKNLEPTNLWTLSK